MASIRPPICPSTRSTVISFSPARTPADLAKSKALADALFASAMANFCFCGLFRSSNSVGLDFLILRIFPSVFVDSAVPLKLESSDVLAGIEACRFSARHRVNRI